MRIWRNELRYEGGGDDRLRRPLAGIYKQEFQRESLLVSLMGLLAAQGEWNLRHRRCPGTAQNISVSAATHAHTRTMTQIARPTSSFLTYGSRMRRVRKGVDSDWPRKTRIGSSSYWWEMRNRMAMLKGRNSCAPRQYLA